ncbi:DUF4811 domain-containing protein [Oenococcus sicerae]|uniref:DUF4811 domain-containing protein n=1 Tax=Oenococcus sicerae TaxID=2203724 RepID=A0AAJ1RF91_9LACO|nr:DUF4811 domain-containing protein [Oenococcus sicerae]MDN6900791.1 DUF4811 domain-containing protein [Oenococcus sicerae]QAS69210.1 DUF4811 domain-containing protein [Oenococcus sicerae]
MIIVLVALLAILAFVSWMLIKNRLLRWFFGLLFSLGLFASLFLMTLNMNQHFGMQRKITIRKTQIYSVADNKLATGILTTATSKKLGNDLVIYVYKSKPAAAKTTSAVPSMATDLSMTQISGNKAYKLVRTVSWQYTNHLSKLFFAVGKLDKKITSKHISFQIPNDQWLQLTSQQLVKLQQIIAHPENIKNKGALRLLAAAQTAEKSGQKEQAAKIQSAAIRILLSITATPNDKKINDKITASSKAASIAAAKSQAAAASSAASTAQAAADSESAAAVQTANEAAAQSAAASSSAATVSSATDSSASLSQSTKNP